MTDQEILQEEFQTSLNNAYKDLIGVRWDDDKDIALKFIKEHYQILEGVLHSMKDVVRPKGSLN